MARQFREQLEEEVQLEEARKAQAAQAAQRAAASAPADPTPPPAEAPALADSLPAQVADPYAHHDATGAEPSAGTGHAPAPDERT